MKHKLAIYHLLNAIEELKPNEDMPSIKARIKDYEGAIEALKGSPEPTIIVQGDVRHNGKEIKPRLTDRFRFTNKLLFIMFGCFALYFTVYLLYSIFTMAIFDKGLLHFLWYFGLLYFNLFMAAHFEPNEKV
jgi:hypothetical protein